MSSDSCAILRHYFSFHSFWTYVYTVFDKFCLALERFVTKKSKNQIFIKLVFSTV